MNGKETYGMKPHFYSDEKQGKLDREAWVRTYHLVTDDWFEVGFAYSLHPDEQKAWKYKTFQWWQPSSVPRRVFVSESTLEEMMKDKKKVVFRDWENGDKYE